MLMLAWKHNNNANMVVSICDIGNMVIGYILGYRLFFMVLSVFMTVGVMLCLFL